MKSKLLFVNSCIRGEKSRTLAIAKQIIECLQAKYEIEEINLLELKLLPVDFKECMARGEGRYSAEATVLARKFATADRIVVAAPFWDMSFPSLLKAFFENISINGITFKNNDDGSTKGNCTASAMMLITTRGMEIGDESPLEQGSSYLRALGWLWGIPSVSVISAVGMDMCDDEERIARINKAIEKGIKLCEDF